MSPEKVAHEDVTQVWVTLLDKSELILNQLLSVLEGKLGEVVHDLDYFSSVDVVGSAEVIEKTNEAPRLACQKTSTFHALQGSDKVRVDRKELTKSRICSFERRYLRNWAIKTRILSGEQQ